MLEELELRTREFGRRIRRFERRELDELRRWIEATDNLIHVSVLLFVPLLIGVVTLLSNTIQQISFLLFPPLASGAYTLFADPEGRYASAWKFVAGLTVGAASGWIALEVTAVLVYHVPIGQFQIPPGQFDVNAGGAALGVFLTGAVTWLLDLEEPAAFSTALLVLVTGTSQPTYVASVAVSSAVVAGAFLVWRHQFYEQRARYLYGTVQGDDHVLVPVRGEEADAVASFGAQLAAAHEAGKVVLLDVVSEGEEDDGDAATADPVEWAARRLEDHAGRIRTRVGVPCEVVVMTAASPDDGRLAIEAAREANCDLVVTPYEEQNGQLSPFVRTLFGSSLDVVAFRATGERTRWKRVMVPVRRPGDVAHAMLDFAGRVAGRTGTVAACHCIDREGERRRAETMLANIVETFEGAIETRVANADIEDFLAANAPSYDLTIVGASTDRTTASRFISPPTFQRLHEIDCDVAVVHRG